MLASAVNISYVLHILTGKNANVPREVVGWVVSRVHKW